MLRIHHPSHTYLYVRHSRRAHLWRCTRGPFRKFLGSSLHGEKGFNAPLITFFVCWRIQMTVCVCLQMLQVANLYWFFMKHCKCAAQSHHIKTILTIGSWIETFAGELIWIVQVCTLDGWAKDIVRPLFNGTGVDVSVRCVLNRAEPLYDLVL